MAMKKREMTSAVAGLLSAIKAGHVEAVGQLADALEEMSADEHALRIRVELLHIQRGVDSWRESALKGDRGRRIPVAEQIARWYGSLLQFVANELAQRWKLSGDDWMRLAIPAAWRIVRQWREERAESETNP
jgi:hypothetical protein